MFIATYKKAPMCYAVSGESRGQVYRKLVQAGLDPNDFIIEEAVDISTYKKDNIKVKKNA